MSTPRKFEYLAILAIGSGLCVCYYNYNRFKIEKLKENDQVFELVEKAIELVKSSEPQPLPILHIREMLLSPHERKSSKNIRIWNQVVEFIENYESRIQTFVEDINGEKYKVWQWIATDKPLKAQH